ncbi:hypothetical protein CsatA_016845 [Cannabis sativa]
MGLTLASTPASSSSSTNSLRLCVVKRPLTTPFFGAGVGAFKVEVVKSVRSNKIRGGALGARMNLFDWFARVVKSYANAVISSFEDPNFFLDQTVIEMSDDLTKMRQATSQISSILYCYLFIQHSPVLFLPLYCLFPFWYRKTQFALEKGDENLTREALKMRKSFVDNANSLKAQLDQQKANRLFKISQRNSYPSRGDLTEEVCHREDGYNLNDRLYEKPLLSFFDVLDD